jgi:hypothetical protein
MDDATHLSEDDIIRYRDRSLPPTELLAADSHLALCDVCHGRIMALTGLRERASVAASAFEDAAAGQMTHLSYEQLAGMVDDQVGDIDREIIDSHLDLCRACESELNDLRQLRSRMARPQESTPTRGKSATREQFITLRLPAFSFLTLASIAAVLLLSFLITIPLRRDLADSRARVAELERSNDSLKERGAAVDGLEQEMARLRDENERLRLASEAQALVALNDGGGRIILDDKGNLSGLEKAQGYEQTVKEALRTERVKMPASLRELRVQAGTLMGSAQAEFRVLAPVGIVVETDRPTFRWSAVDGASYTVTVYDSSLAKVAESDSLTTTEWTLRTALTRGRTYVWQVRATKEGRQLVAPPPAAGRAKFRVLEQSKVEEVALAKQSEPRSHLVMGLIYAESGLVDEAARELNALLRANPNSTIVRKLIRSLGTRN